MLHDRIMSGFAGPGRLPLRRRFLYPASVSLILVALDPAVVMCATAEPQAAPQAQAAAVDSTSKPVRVSDLIGQPILDENKSTMGHVRAVVRTQEGQVQLLMPLGGLFGFGERLVPIPVELVALLGTKVAVVKAPEDRFQKTPTWYGWNSRMLDPAEIVNVGVLTR
jgi:hypothetical protein